MQDFRISTFLSVCETMNFTESAKRLHITQPAVSQQIRFLEKTYGFPLFDYQNRKLLLTKQGTLLRDGCKSLRCDEALLCRKIAAATEQRELIKLGLTMTVGEYMAARTIARIMKTHQETRLDIQVYDTSVLLAKIEEGDIDCAIIEGFFDRTRYSSKVLRQEPFIGVCSPVHALFKDEHLSFEDILDEDLIAREEGSGTRAVLEHALAAENLSVHDFESITQITSLALIKELVQEDCGIAFLYQAAVSDALAAGTLRQIPLRANTMGHDICAVWRRDTMYSGFYADFFDEFME